MYSLASSSTVIPWLSQRGILYPRHTKPSVLEKDPLNQKCLEIHISCLSQVGDKGRLFELSHRLISEHPDWFLSWLAVGTYYLSIEKYTDSRRYFRFPDYKYIFITSKCTTMKQDYGFGWICFGHSFAGDGEYDQAINAYATALKLMPG